MKDKATNPPFAPFLVRIAAVLFVASLPSLYLVGNAQTGWQRHLFQAYILGVLFAYFSTFWLRSGQTLAMKTWRIRLVAEGGSRLTLKQAGLRFVLALLGLLLAGVGFAWALIDRDGQFLHDRIAGTRLVRVPRRAGP